MSFLNESKEKKIPKKQPEQAGELAQYYAAANLVKDLHQRENLNLTEAQLSQIEDQHFADIKKHFDTGTNKKFSMPLIKRADGNGHWKITVGRGNDKSLVHDVLVEHIPGQGQVATHDEFGHEIKGGLKLDETTGKRMSSSLSPYKGPRPALVSGQIKNPKSALLTSESSFGKNLLSGIRSIFTSKVSDLRNLRRGLIQSLGKKPKEGTVRHDIDEHSSREIMDLYGKLSLAKTRKINDQDAASPGSVITLVHGSKVKRFSTDPSDRYFIGRHISGLRLQRKGNTDEISLRINKTRLGGDPTTKEPIERGEDQAIKRLIEDPNIEGMPVEHMLEKHKRKDLKENTDQWIRSKLRQRGIIIN